MRCPQTPPLRRSQGAGGMLAMVKVEDGWAQSPPVPAPCQLSRQGHSPYFTGDSREVRVPRWGPMTLGKFWVPKPTGKYLLLFRPRSLCLASSSSILVRVLNPGPCPGTLWFQYLLSTVGPGCDAGPGMQVAPPPFSSELGAASVEAESTFRVPHWRISCLADPWSLQ